MRRKRPELGSPADWLRHARSDLIIASKAAGPGVLTGSLCFHCQQAAEKALKAVFVHREVEFPLTHNLARLIAAIQEFEAGSAENLSRVAELTQYSVEARYPGLHAEVTEEDYRCALDIAKATVAWAKTVVSRPS